MYEKNERIDCKTERNLVICRGGEFMSPTRRKTFMSILMAIAIVLSGMCFEKIEADSSFTCVGNEKSISVLKMARNVSFMHDVCREEQMGRLVEQSSHTGEEVPKWDASVLSVGSLLMRNSLRRAKTAISGMDQQNFTRDVIIEFVHHQDGSKV